MPAFDVLIMPSRYESLSYVLLEAAAADVPILASSTAYASDALPATGTCVLLPNRDDSDLWSKALDDLLDSIEQRDSVPGAKPSPHRATLPTARHMVSETVAVYEAATARQKI
jgi:glycosyltransferase involved in cell wall biosynthesis